MLIAVRDRYCESLLVKDVLDLDFDMRVGVKFKDGITYYVIYLNSKFTLNELFTTEDEAINYMISLAEKINKLEKELSNE